MSTYRYFRVTAAEQNHDVRWDSFESRRYDVAGLGWAFVSLVRAANQEDAEEQFRNHYRFRKTANQNGADWRTVFVLVEPTTVAQGIS